MTATLLRHLAPRRPRATRCEMCGEPIGDGPAHGQEHGNGHGHGHGHGHGNGQEHGHGHGHVADLDARSILCVCAGCRLLFTRAGAGGGRYQAVPTRYRYQARFPAGADLLAAAGIPVRLAFFVIHDGMVSAFYPSPGGATQSELPPSVAPDDLRLRGDRDADGSADGSAAGSPDGSGCALAPEVEGLLVHATGGDGGGGHEGYLLPIDACYRLVGELRLHWRGFDGGQQARERVAAFLADARRRAGARDG